MYVFIRVYIYVQSSDGAHTFQFEISMVYKKTYMRITNVLYQSIYSHTNQHHFSKIFSLQKTISNAQLFKSLFYLSFCYCYCCYYCYYFQMQNK